MFIFIKARREAIMSIIKFIVLPLVMSNFCEMTLDWFGQFGLLERMIEMWRDMNLWWKLLNLYTLVWHFVGYTLWMEFNSPCKFPLLSLALLIAPILSWCRTLKSLRKFLDSKHLFSIYNTKLESSYSTETLSCLYLGWKRTKHSQIPPTHDFPASFHQTFMSFTLLKAKSKLVSGLAIIAITSVVFKLWRSEGIQANRHVVNIF